MSEVDVPAGDTEPSQQPAGPLDELDRGVLHELQLDGRRSFREIARSLGASEATVRFRVKRLRDSGVLQILGFIDPAALGYGLLADVLLHVQPGAHDVVVAAVSAWPEAMYVSSTVGGADLYVQIVCKDQAALLELLSERLGRLAGVQKAKTLVELKVHKARYVYDALGAEPTR
jgi:Lrp/AsnC family transcriptional regulator for asnA, asnC and gidA